MATAKSEIDAFLDRELDDWSFLKRVPRSRLVRLVDELPYPAEFVTDPWHSQLVAFYLGAFLGELLLYLDMSAGKSKVLLDLVAYWSHRDSTKSALICVPSEVHYANWAEQATIHAPDLTFGVADSKDKKKRARQFGLEPKVVRGREKLVDEGPIPNVLVTTYAALIATFTDLPEVKGAGRQINHDLVRRAMRRFHLLAMDEIHYAKNHDTLLFRTLRAVSKNVDFRYGATGTSFGKDPGEMWAQFFLVDHGETLDPTYGLFRDAFYREVSNGFGVEYQFDKRMKRRLKRMIRHRSLTYLEHELADLPDQAVERVRLNLPQEAQADYDALTETGASLEEPIYHRLRGIASGYVKVDVEGDKMAVPYDRNVKLEWFKDLLASLPPKEQIVIFYWYQDTGAIIEDFLGDRCVRLWSGTDDTMGEFSKWKSKRCQVLVMNQGVGAEGLNLQQSRVTVFWENHESPIKRRQALRRTKRPGGKKSVVYDLLAAPVERAIVRSLDDGANLFDSVMSGELGFEDIAD